MTASDCRLGAIVNTLPEPLDRAGLDELSHERLDDLPLAEIQFKGSGALVDRYLLHYRVKPIFWPQDIHAAVDSVAHEYGAILVDV